MTVSAPATNAWDAPAIAARALAVLRLDPLDADAARIGSAAVEATELIDDYLDLVEPLATIPEAVLNAAVTVAVEQYKRKDASFGVLDAWSSDGVPIRLSSDPLRGVRASLRPWKKRWSLG